MLRNQNVIHFHISTWNYIGQFQDIFKLFFISLLVICFRISVFANISLYFFHSVDIFLRIKEIRKKDEYSTPQFLFYFPMTQGNLTFVFFTLFFFTHGKRKVFNLTLGYKQPKSIIRHWIRKHFFFLQLQIYFTFREAEFHEI